MASPVRDARLVAANISYLALFDKGMDMLPTWNQQVCEMAPSDTEANVYPWLQDIGAFERNKGERRYQTLAALEYYLRNEVFDDAIRIPLDAVKDDKLGLFNRSFQQLGMQAKKFPDYFTLELITGYASKKCYDGQPFFSNAHPIDPNAQGSATFSNLLTAKPLTQSNYDTGRVTMQQFKSETGFFRGYVPDLLIVGADNEFKAKKIVGIPTDAGTSGSDAGNRENVFYGSAKLLVIPEWDAQGQWILAHTQRLKPFARQVREAARMLPALGESSEHAIKHRELLYVAEAREAYGYTHPYLAILNQPS